MNGMMEPMLVNYQIRMAPLGNNWFSRQSLERLEQWYKVHKKSGLFRDPRCSQLLCGWVNIKRRQRRLSQ